MSSEMDELDRKTGNSRVNANITQPAPQPEEGTTFGPPTDLIYNGMLGRGRLKKENGEGVAYNFTTQEPTEDGKGTKPKTYENVPLCEVRECFTVLHENNHLIAAENTNDENKVDLFEIGDNGKLREVKNGVPKGDVTKVETEKKK